MSGSYFVARESFSLQKGISLQSRLWESLPTAYRERVIVATDQLPVYEALVPERWHATGEKGSGLTNHMERFFGSVRQRCARLVRKTLSFSWKMENHVGALWYFIRHYNLCRA